MSHSRYNLLYDTIDEKTKKIINPLISKSPVNIEKIASKLGIRIHNLILAKGMSGMITRKKESTDIYINSFDEEYRKRFTIAHEVSHFLLGHLDKHDKLSENSLLRSNKLSNREEVDANYLAAELLMPMEEIERLIDKYNKKNDEVLTLEILADELQVSKVALKNPFGDYIIFLLPALKGA